MTTRLPFPSLGRVHRAFRLTTRRALGRSRSDFATEAAGQCDLQSAGHFWRIALLLGALFTAMLAAPLQATSVEPPDFATLVAQAELIFSGEVINVRSEWVGQGANRHISSHVSFKVLKTMKGNPPATYVLNMLGGTVGEQTLEIGGAPKFKVGDRSVLFVENNGTQFVPLVGIMHGHYRIKRDAATGEEVLHKHDGTPLSGTQEIDRIHAAGPLHEHKAANPAAKAMKRTEFEDAIERHLRSQGK